MKKEIIKIGTICLLATELSGILMSQSSEVIVYASESNIKDIDIRWLDYNIEVYVGAEIEFEAYIKGDETFDNIVWNLNNEGIISLDTLKKQAKLIALNEGEVEIAACVPDGSESCIHRNMFVKAYGESEAEQEIIAPFIQPIQQIGLETKELQVEIQQKIPSEDKGLYLDQYLHQLVFIGELTQEKTEVNMHPRYDFYTFRIGNRLQTLTIRIDRQDQSYTQLTNIIENYENYNTVLPCPPEEPEQPVPPVDPGVPPEEPEQPVPPVDPGVPPEEPEQPVPPVDPGVPPEEPEQPLPPSAGNESVLDDLTLGIPNVSVIPNKHQDGSNSAPYQIQANEELTMSQQYTVMEQYLHSLALYRKVQFISLNETDTQFVYRYKVSKRMYSRLQSENDFYIEFIINKQTKEVYPLVTMRPKPGQETLLEESEIELDSKTEGLESKLMNVLRPMTIVNAQEVVQNTPENREELLVQNNVSTNLQSQMNPYIYMGVVVTSVILGGTVLFIRSRR